MARPTKLDPERQATIITNLERGIPQETAARLAGLAPATLYAWKSRGEAALAAAMNALPDGADNGQLLAKVPAAERPFVEFLEAVETARAEAEMSYALVVRRAALGGDVRAAQWWLDRAYPERWAQRQTVAVRQEGNIRVVIEGW